MDCKHGGCYECGNKEQVILQSLSQPNGMGIALCDSCFEIKTKKGK